MRRHRRELILARMHYEKLIPFPERRRRGAPWLGACMIAGAAAWLAVYFVYFYSFTLPNDPAGQSRGDVWIRILVGSFQETKGPPESWANFSQRLPILLVAGMILAGAWGLGHLVLRCIRPPIAPRCLERTVFAFGLGLSGLSLVTLGFGCAGLLDRRLLGGVIAVCVVAEAVFRIRGIIRHSRGAGVPETPSPPGRKRRLYWLPVACCVVVVPFLLAMVLGSLLPSVDFDVKEYHFEGPKEYFLNGRITFLPHNVYTSFPFLTEMLTLLAMVLHGDWYWGALAGKAVLMCFAPLTALGLVAAGKRWFSPAAGWLAAMVYLSTPWVYRISIIAYTEGGLAFFLFAGLLAAMIALAEMNKGSPSGRPVFLTGLLAGSGMACKYPGVVSVVIPLGATLLVAAFVLSALKGARGRTAFRLSASFALGTLITIGPWLLKNTIETGNPVYPLLYGVFGGRDMDAALSAKFTAGHRPPNYEPQWLLENLIDVTAKSDWLSPLLFGLAPLALLVGGKRRAVSLLWAYVAYLFLTWWLLTHRVDRFWVPMIPVVALLAGIGATLRAHAVWRLICGGFIAAAVVFNIGFATTELCGLNTYLIDYDFARDWTATITSPEILALNRMNLSPTQRVLSVGDAEVFDARFPVIYNTVFDRSIFEEWCAAPEPGMPASQLKLRDPAQIHRKLADEQIALVYVNWREILRYRLPASYGYTNFVTPARFAELQQAGVLGPSLSGLASLSRFDELTDAERLEVEQWAPALKQTFNGETWIVGCQVFPVQPITP